MLYQYVKKLFWSAETAKQTTNLVSKSFFNYLFLKSWKMRNYTKLLFSTVFNIIITFRNWKLDLSTKCKDILLSVPIPPKEGFEVSTLKSITFILNVSLNQLPVTRVSISWISNAHHWHLFIERFSNITKGVKTTFVSAKLASFCAIDSRCPTACTWQHL